MQLFFQTFKVAQRRTAILNRKPNTTIIVLLLKSENGCSALHMLAFNSDQLNRGNFARVRLSAAEPNSELLPDRQVGGGVDEWVDADVEESYKERNGIEV